ncbi:hypothetical protein BH11PSE3_BH11PSE3_35530 [soil metagenome]
MTSVVARPRRADVGIEEVASILYVGNSFLSFNNGIGWHVSQMHASIRPQRCLRATSAIITGGALDWHDVESYFRPNAIGSYSFDEANNVVFNHFSQLFDVVLMMDSSQGPLHPELKAAFQVSARKHSGTVRRHGARPAFLMTWAYEDRPEMTGALAEAYTAAGNDNDALVIPVGLAFAAALAVRPDLRLHMDDRRHPTLAGTYLAACTVHAALLRRSPVGLGYSAGLDAATVALLQEIALDTVERYYGYGGGAASSDP